MTTVGAGPGRQPFAREHCLHRYPEVPSKAQRQRRRHGSTARRDLRQRVRLIAQDLPERLPRSDAQTEDVQRGAYRPLLLRGQVVRRVHGITSRENSASTPSSSIACTMQVRFQSNTFASTSFCCATNVRDRTLPPNFALIAPNVDSTLLRLW